MWPSTYFKSGRIKKFLIKHTHTHTHTHTLLVLNIPIVVRTKLNNITNVLNKDCYILPLVSVLPLLPSNPIHGTKFLIENDVLLVKCSLSQICSLMIIAHLVLVLFKAHRNALKE